MQSLKQRWIDQVDFAKRGTTSLKQLGKPKKKLLLKSAKLKTVLIL